MYDLAIIGGGINGCGIARDAAGRGLKVLLLEMNDLAAGTSSRSTKLIHGGLRYLEQYEFSLVRHSLMEREVLYRIAPHIISPLRFVLPYQENMRPLWLMRLGLFLYDHLGGRRLLPASHRIDLTRDVAGQALKPGLNRGFEYSDCRVDDARLVILNALDAHERGADIRVGTRLVAARRQNEHWALWMEDRHGIQTGEARARILINAAGPWVADVLDKKLAIKTHSHIRPVKGSHIVFKKLFDHDRAYIFQNPDGRIVFAIPYERDFTLVGTTDVPLRGDPGRAKVSREEVTYLCRAINRCFKKSVQPKDVVWRYAGVRPLFGDEQTAASELTRDYVLEVERGRKERQAPLLSIFGGKITTYRQLAEKVLERMKDDLPPGTKEPWTAKTALPGGDFEVDGFATLVDELTEICAVPTALAQRLISAYGTRAREIFSQEGKGLERGTEFGHGLCELEVRYLIEHEWAQTADDILWRRSKLGLRFSNAERHRLAAWMRKYHERDVS